MGLLESSGPTNEALKTSAPAETQRSPPPCDFVRGNRRGSPVGSGQTYPFISAATSARLNRDLPKKRGWEELTPPGKKGESGGRKSCAAFPVDHGIPDRPYTLA